jgi:murein DD-endopeptidase MepM/ murein hydrolase activator NlpD
MLTGSGLLIAHVAALSVGPTFAEPSVQQSKLDLVRMQRPIADDFAIDQSLVATVPSLNAAVADSGGEMRIAAIGPAMRPLVPQFNALWPTRGLITTYFGEVGPYSPRGHAGIDVAAPQGTPIQAIDDGEVLKAYWNEDGYGGLVIIGHPSGYETWYGHMARFSVEKGQQVKRGEAIGAVGSTGYSTGPHLHFEVRQDGQLIDPLHFLKEANLQDAVW